MPAEQIVLASASVIRRQLLEAAGIALIVDAADLDEAAIKQREQAQGSAPVAVAEALARAKAEAVAARHPGKWVLGADQVLSIDAKIFNKPANMTEARRHLKSFRGRSHQLLSAVSLVHGGSEQWSTVASATLWVRDFSDAFLDAYLALEGENVLGSVGCYRLESRGLTLFDRIDGDYFTVLGLPMLPLLAAFRNAGILPS
ncbi:MAG: Maf family nucleotide pyrophosphatase [Proteobacteria bacterium]|nr:Maf family nucleotide pyrophosphatase [Pseudomonadota bacterium]